jgi:hypothetical protein
MRSDANTSWPRERLPGRATWKRHSATVDQTVHPPLAAGLGELHGVLLEVTGRYLDCIVADEHEEIPFAYEIREASPGFLKLDVMNEIMVVGVDVRTGPVNRMMQAVERTYHLAASGLGRGDQFTFVPIVVFGDSSPYLYYVESMRGFGQVSPFFIRSAQAFLSSQIFPSRFEQDIQRMLEYVGLLTERGDDPENLVARQPLFAALLAQVTDGPRREMLRQIGADIGMRHRVHA